MGIVDDLITAGVSAVTGFSGVRIGVKATRKTSVESFERAVHRENEAWRVALRHECELNAKLEMDQSPDDLWSYETRMLRESSAHAGAFTSEVLQRIVWARSANGRLEALLVRLRDNELQVVAQRMGEVQKLRKQVSGELSEIEKQLRA
jgi:hypothetical protein